MIRIDRKPEIVRVTKDVEGGKVFLTSSLDRGHKVTCSTGVDSETLRTHEWAFMQVYMSPVSDPATSLAQKVADAWSKI